MQQEFKVHFYHIDIPAQDITVKAESVEDAIMLAKKKWHETNKPTVGDIEEDQ